MGTGSVEPAISTDRTLTTAGGYAAIVDGKDTTRPQMIHGRIIVGMGIVQRAVWFPNGRYVGFKDADKYNLPTEVVGMELPAFILVEIEK